MNAQADTGRPIMADRVEVIVADDCLLIRDSVCQAVATDPSLRVVGVGVDYDSTAALLDEHPFAVLITDVRMPPTMTDEGIRLARWAREAYPDTAVIVLSQYVQPSYAAGLLEHGSARRGYLLKERIAQFDELTSAVHTVSRGGTVLDPTVVTDLLRQPARNHAVDHLTGREREVLAEIASGASNGLVAQRLVVSHRAVEKHVNAIFAKFGLTADRTVDRRVKAVLMYLAASASV